MKKILLMTVLFAVVTLNSNAQSCCKKPTGMQAMAMNADFRAAHEAPEPLNYAPDRGRMMNVAVKGGEEGHVFFVPSPKPTDKVLFVFHEWWGLNDYIKREAESLQAELGNVDVYAIDLYDGKVATTPDEAGKMMGGLDRARGKAIIEGLIATLGGSKKIATIGWCMGGTWSFNGTIAAGKQAAGCVMYYGFPEEDEKIVKTIKTDILFIRGNLDTYISKESIDQLGKRVKSTHHQFEMVGFDAVHAFANPSNPKYDVKAATEAHKLAMKFLRAHLAL